jgi:hypothetical protein
MASLLRIMVLQADAPPSFVLCLKPPHAEIVTVGRRIRALLQVYLEQQTSLLEMQTLLPTVLLCIVTAYAVPTRVDVWTDWWERL